MPKPIRARSVGARRASAYAPHLLLELFKLEAGVNIVHVPYRGTAPMLAAIVAGKSKWPRPDARPSCRTSNPARLRPIAIAGTERTPKLPDVPTTTEAGYPEAGRAILARRGGAGGYAARHHRQAQLPLSAKASLQPETRARLATLGAEIKIGTPAEFGKLLAEELATVDRRREGRQHQGGMRRAADSRSAFVAIALHAYAGTGR